MARDLSALMKISTTVNAIRGVEELRKTLLELLFEVYPRREVPFCLRPSMQRMTSWNLLFRLRVASASRPGSIDQGQSHHNQNSFAATRVHLDCKPAGCTEFQG